VDPELLAILACPFHSNAPLIQEDPSLLVCTKCRRRFPIKDGIPVLVAEAAQPAS